jgi:hypothetical protein
MRREEGFVKREDEPTRPVHVTRLRPETAKVQKISLEPPDSADEDSSAPRKTR